MQNKEKLHKNGSKKLIKNSTGTQFINFTMASHQNNYDTMTII